MHSATFSALEEDDAFVPVPAIVEECELAQAASDVAAAMPADTAAARRRRVGRGIAPGIRAELYGGAPNSVVTL
jgi:hypothetical protein